MNARDWNERESRDWNDGDSGPGWADAADEKVIGTIDHYELLRELGTGGFGSVYLARDTVSRTFVAVKGLPREVSDSAGELERILANFALVSKLKHTNVAAVLALHRVGAIACGDSEVLRKLNVKSGDTLQVMDYAPGVTLDSWCRQFTDRKVPVDQAIEVTRQIAAALDAAHKLKIVHRDIKPQNVMVETLADGTFTARVLDFGLAAEVRSSMNRVSGEVRKDSLGVYPYMSPEQFEGRRPSAAMDRYALAALFYELVTGDVPFSSMFECGDKKGLINVITTKPPEIPAELPRPVRKALVRALAKEPKERFATCGDFVAALQGVPPVVPIRWGLVTGILAAVAVVGVGAWWLGGGRMTRTLGTDGTSATNALANVTAVPSASVVPDAQSLPTEEELRALELAAGSAVYDLMRDMESAKKKIAAESDEVRSFFASEIRAFEKKFESAKEAKSDSRLVRATNFLAQAKAQADALRKLVDARRDSLVARQRVLGARKTADEVEAKTVSASRYDEAVKLFEGGEDHANRRDFAQAQSNYVMAAQSFADMTEQIRAQELAAKSVMAELTRNVEEAQKTMAAESEIVRTFFGPEIGKVETILSSAKTAKSSSHFVSATNYLVQAKARSDELKRLVEASKESLAVRQRALEARKDVDALDVKQALASRYDEAVKLFDGGDEDVRQHNFVQARSAYESALKAFSTLMEQIRAEEVRAKDVASDLMRDSESAKVKIDAGSGPFRSFYEAEIRSFEKELELAKAATNGLHFARATNILVKAKIQAETLCELAEASKEALAARQRALDTRKTADAVDAKSELVSRYDEAARLFDGGDGSVRQRDFARAKSVYETTEKTFAALRVDVISNKLEQARRYEADMQWPNCLTAANKVLGWEPGNDEAVALKRKAEGMILSKKSEVSSRKPERKPPPSPVPEPKPYGKYVMDNPIKGTLRGFGSVLAAPCDIIWGTFSLVDKAIHALDDKVTHTEAEENGKAIAEGVLTSLALGAGAVGGTAMCLGDLAMGLTDMLTLGYAGDHVFYNGREWDFAPWCFGRKSSWSYK